MPARIPIEDPQVAIQDPGNFRPVLPQVLDAGRQIAQVGPSLLASAEPKLRRENQEQATYDAGMAALGRDELGGYYTRPPLPKAGTAYTDAWNQVVDDRLVNATTADFSRTIAGLRNEHRYDPENFMRVAKAAGEGVLANIDPRVRPKVEQYMMRETAQYANGVMDDTWRQNVSNTADEAAAKFTATIAEATNLLADPNNPVAVAEAQRKLGELRSIQEPLIALGQTSGGVADARVRVAVAQLQPKIQTAAELQDLSTVAAQMFNPAVGADGQSVGMGEEEADLVYSIMATGADYGEQKIYGLTSAEWLQRFTQPGVRDLIGQQAYRRARALESDRRALEAAARGERTATALEGASRAITRHNANNYDAANGYSKEEVASQNEQLFDGNRLNIRDMMTTGDPKDGQPRLLAHMRKYGHFPPQLVEYIKDNIQGRRLPEVVQFLNNVVDLESEGGTPVGSNLLRDIGGPAAALYNQWNSMERAGLTDDAKRIFVDRVVDGTAYQSDKLPERIPKYAVQRAKALSDRWGRQGIDVNQVLQNRKFVEDFDNLVANNMMVNGGNVDQALADGVEYAGRYWAKWDKFLGGFGPLEVSRAVKGLTPRQLDAAFGLREDDPKTGGATFSNGWAVFDPRDYNPDAEVGNYNIVFLRRGGERSAPRVFSSKPVNIGKVLQTKQVEIKRQQQRHRDDLLSAAKKRRDGGMGAPAPPTVWYPLGTAF